ncbi:MAG TPA: protein-glutamate O-methyltransferase CheR [Candidatus Aminicenantes bacterium]|nr:protein-glutamate O-methyltransferase CheR [Candidatus Aminicenantes bacterium]
MEKLELSYQEFTHLRDLIYRKSGMFFPDYKQEYLSLKVENRIAALHLASLHEYLSHLENHYGELQNLFNEVTVNETYFYREETSAEILLSHILYPLLEAQPIIKIVCAGCSTGEEPYTLALFLKERFPLLLQRFKILACDLNTAVLEKARLGRYRAYSVRNVPERIRERYFTAQEGGEYLLSQEIRSMVEFFHMNLLDIPFFSPFTGSDVIVCRNVLIYFDMESRKKVIKDFHDALTPEGHLILGKTESIFSINELFTLVHYPQTIFYRKEVHP